MKYMMLAVITTFLAGCIEPKNSTVITDQCLRTQIFKECVATTQHGLKGITLHEDGDGIGDSVRACSEAAYYQARRLRENVKPECSAE